MANYISRHSGAEIDAAIEQVQYKINKPEGALKDEILIFDGSNWISSNFINKHNTQAVWDAMTDYIPDKGEIIVYDIDDNADHERFKIGDGVRTVSKLPFYMVDQINAIMTEIMTELSKKVEASVEEHTLILTN